MLVIDQSTFPSCPTVNPQATASLLSMLNTKLYEKIVIMKKSILLITGAGGWLGSTLIEMLSKNGISNTYDLIIISSLSSFDYKDIDLGLIKKFFRKNLILKNIGDLADNKFYKKLAHLINDNDKLSIVYTSSIIHAKSAKEFRKINFESLKYL